jgi:hypothetical protein
MKLLKKVEQLPLPVQIALLAGAGFALYKGLNYILKRAPVIAPLPTGGAGIPATGFDAQGQPVAWSPEPLAASLYNELSGPSLVISPSKTAVMIQLVSLPTADMIAAVYNTFNIKYGDGETLTQWIADEWTFPGQAQALTKLRGLGLN